MENAVGSDDPQATGAIDWRAFLQGMLAVVFVYVSLFTLFWLKGPEELAKIEESLASVTIKVEREHIAAAPVDTQAPEELAPLQDIDLDQPRMSADGSLAVAPIDGMFERTSFGKLPQVRPGDKLTPFDAYKRPFTPPASKKLIALIVTDFGMSDTVSQAAINSLPADVTMLLSPYSLEPERWTGAARQDGHEVWLDVKFENAAFPASDPGPQAILAASSLKYNQDRLSWNMGRASGYAGVGGYTDYVFDSATSLLHPLLKSVYQRGVGYLELNPQASRTIEAVAVMMGGPYVRADVVINDNKSSPRAGSPLKELERIAAEQGYAVGVLIPSEDAVKEINTWLASLESKGIALAPVSAIGTIQMHAENQPAQSSSDGY